MSSLREDVQLMKSLDVETTPITFTIEEAAVALRIPAEQIRTLIRDGKIGHYTLATSPGVRIGAPDVLHLAADRDDALRRFTTIAIQRLQGALNR